MTIGKRLRRARRETGLTDDQLAEELGVEVSTLRAWELEVETPSDEQLQRLAELVNMDGETLSHLAASPAPQGICSAVDLVPDRSQAEALEQVGLPPELWDDPDRWVAFLRLAAAAADLSPDEISRLAREAETCVVGD